MTPDPKRQHALPDFETIHREHRRPGVTLELLHLEYLAEHPDDGYRYTQFCALYRRWLERRRLTMRQIHRAGDKAFVDYSGQRPHLVDPRTGECTPVELLVMVLGASNLTYAEATLTQRGPEISPRLAQVVMVLDRSPPSPSPPPSAEPCSTSPLRPSLDRGSCESNMPTSAVTRRSARSRAGYVRGAIG